MPEYSIKEFGVLVGKEPKQVHTLIARDKLIKNERKKIDTSISINSIYLELNKVNGEQKKVNGKSTPKKEKSPEKIIKDTHQLIIEEKSRIELENKRKDLEIKELELSKKRNELINLEQTITLVSNYSESMKRELDQNIKTLIQDICARHGISPSKAGEYKLKVAKLINKSNKSSIELLLKKLGNE